jgi:hypothetical protein
LSGCRPAATAARRGRSPESGRRPGRSSCAPRSCRIDERRHGDGVAPRRLRLRATPAGREPSRAAVLRRRTIVVRDELAPQTKAASAAHCSCVSRTRTPIATARRCGAPILQEPATAILPEPTQRTWPRPLVPRPDPACRRHWPGSRTHGQRPVSVRGAQRWRSVADGDNTARILTHAV